MIRTMVPYSRWANEQLLEAVRTAGSDLLLRDLGGSFPSRMDTLNHILWVEMLFLRRWKALPAGDVSRPPTFVAIDPILSPHQRITPPLSGWPGHENRRRAGFP